MSPILEAFRAHCRDRPREAAVWSRKEDLRLDFAAVEERVDAWIAALAYLPAGRPVGLATGNTVAFPELFLALLATGRPVVCLDASAGIDEVVGQAERLKLGEVLVGSGERPTKDSGESAGKAAGQAARRISSFGPGVDRITWPAVLDGGEPALPPGTVLVKLTSGSTGAAEGICLDEAALAAGIRQIAEGMEITSADRILVSIPLSHSYGFDNGVLSFAWLGTPLILAGNFFPAPLLKALREGEATFFPAVPPMVRVLAETRWPRGLPLRRVISAGGPLAPEFAAAFHRASGVRVHQFYGSTETGGITFETAPEEPEATGTVGRPLPGVELDLRDGGRVIVRSAACLLGRLGDPEPLADRDVELGDRAEWTPEGRLRLIGRSSDLLNVGGRRVSGAAIEAALRALPGVREAAVLGIADPLRGDRVVAFVVSDGPCVEPQQLPSRLTPREIRRIDALPYTSRGKLDRARLRALALGDD